ncbi:proprotein convertase subtilisin/kexin type 7-like [Gigantopelta aegis]|uniref:proprotein convertase subtilisin/kexin type 7-like n=1 Tax=Gigantopelta aegis TaxID=1735272 RepID=UPI001B88A4C6|nr:proprotein convertase subtilisin/kexin type 7-like [Gigantopelta aegis]
MPIQRNQWASCHGYWYLHLCWILGCLSVTGNTLFTSSIGKKVVHFDHNGNHEESLCWAVKLKENHDHVTLLQGRQFTLSAPHIRLISLGQISDFQNHISVCHWSEHETNKQVPNFETLHKVHRNVYDLHYKKFAELKQSVESLLEGDNSVEWFSPYVVRSRQKRSLHFQDPFFPRQWHLRNRASSGMDINVTGVWEHNVTGVGVTVAVVDDGLEWTNPDLHSNYNYKGSWDLNDNDPDPMPNARKATNHHGTRCAGEIAAVANTVCGVGVAYKAKISGLRVLDGPMTDSLEASAFNKKLQVNDIYSCSWGPDDDGKTVDGPHILAAKAMKYGVDFGRKGYGSIYVVASGNGGHHQDNCNYDGYANSIYTVTIGSVDETGRMPYYAEECASMLGVTFSSGNHNNRAIVTTDWRLGSGTGCTEHHTGTSAAAPIAAGMIALILQARPCLTWRDVQYLMIITAVKVDVDIAHWQRNGAGLYHSHKHGFGLLKAWRLVNAAKVWDMVPWITSYSVIGNGVNLKIPKGSGKSLTVPVTVDDYHIQGYSLYVLEHVQVTVTITHPCRGTLGVVLICPSGTRSVIGAPRPNDNSTLGFSAWTFTTVRCWGEPPTGKYRIVFTDKDTKHSEFGVLKNWRLTLFGTPMMPEEFLKRRQLIEEAMSGVFLNDSYQRPCPPPPVMAQPNIPMSQRTLKILALACVFCAVMCVYETLEYAFCYNDEKKEHRRKLKLAARAQRLADRSRPEPVNSDDITESTGLLQAEDIPMETFPLMSSSATAINTGANNSYDNMQDGGEFLSNRVDNCTDARSHLLSSVREDGGLLSNRVDNCTDARSDLLSSVREDGGLLSNRVDNCTDPKSDWLSSVREGGGLLSNRVDNCTDARSDLLSSVREDGGLLSNRVDNCTDPKSDWLSSVREGGGLLSNRVNNCTDPKSDLLSSVREGGGLLSNRVNNCTDLRSDLFSSDREVGEDISPDVLSHNVWKSSVPKSDYSTSGLPIGVSAASNSSLPLNCVTDVDSSDAENVLFTR